MKTMRLQVGQLLTVTAPPISGGTFWQLCDTNNPNAGSPTLAAFGPSGSGAVKQMKMGIGDSLYATGHIDHDYKVNSIVYPHVHWSTGGTSTASVKWQFTCVSAIGHNQGNFTEDVVITVEEAAQGTAWRHMITEDSVGIAGGTFEVDALWITEIKRITNGGTNNTDDVFIHFADLHYEVQQYATPNRTPNFYE